MSIKERIACWLIERLVWWAIGGDYQRLENLEFILSEVRKLRLKRANLTKRPAT